MRKPIAFALLALALLGFVVAATSTDVQDIDEACYAEAAREMVESGEWVLTQKNYKPFFQHPPLVMWVTAISYKLFGVSAFAARLQALLGGLAGLWLTYLLASHFYGSRVGRLSALLLASSFGYYLMIKDARLDMALTVSVLATVVLYLKAERRPVFWVAMGATMGVATLIKGPVGMLLPSAVVGCHLLLRRRLRALWSWRTAAGLLLALAIAIPWYWVMSNEHGPAFLERIVGRQTFGRLLHEQLTASRAWWFYLRSLGWMFLPWFLPLGIGLARRAAGWWRAKRPLTAEPDTLLVIYFALPFVVFSLSRSQLDHYFCPLLPPAAALAAKTLDDLLASSASGARALRGALATLAVVLPASLLVTLVTFFPPASLLPWLLLASLPLALTLILLWPSERPGEKVVACVATSLVGVGLFVSVYLAPAVMAYQPSRRFAEAVKAHNHANAAIYAYGTTTRPSLNFYAERILRKATDKELIAKLAEEKFLFVLAPTTRRPELEQIGCLEPLAQAPMFHTSRPSLRFLKHSTRKQVVKELAIFGLHPCEDVAAVDGPGG